uniref:Uncharacterized protein n=1 Tax=Candidatus Kentrum sp. MB TaxID=2138164 RepID=A0A451B8N8_9GAMM|nr:MAG: hypothetical protein BECKMB1821I_GA0114274_1001127 [Candidatus Kentron sp. MB]VFK74635.1 MAG: hypothetical protein BECKMB1821H_GA0114242_100754 [Candidatus Kentron sp. MB]
MGNADSQDSRKAIRMKVSLILMSSSFDLRLYCLSISSISRENRKLSQIAKIAKMIEMTSGPMVAPSEIPLILL